jgi:hypothetical protein
MIPEILAAKCRIAGVEALTTYYGVFASRYQEASWWRTWAGWDGAYVINEK